MICSFSAVCCIRVFTYIAPLHFQELLAPNENIVRQYIIHQNQTDNKQVRVCVSTPTCKQGTAAVTNQRIGPAAAAPPLRRMMDGPTRNESADSISVASGAKRGRAGAPPPPPGQQIDLPLQRALSPLPPSVYSDECPIGASSSSTTAACARVRFLPRELPEGVCSPSAVSAATMDTHVLDVESPSATLERKVKCGWWTYICTRIESNQSEACVGEINTHRERERQRERKRKGTVGAIPLAHKQQEDQPGRLFFFSRFELASTIWQGHLKKNGNKGCQAKEVQRQPQK